MYLVICLVVGRVLDAGVGRAIDLEVPSPFFELAQVRRYLSGVPLWRPFGFNWGHNWNVYLP